MKPRYQIEFRHPTITYSEWCVETDPIDDYDTCLEHLHYLREDATKSVDSYRNLCEFRLIKLTPEVLDV